MKNNLKRFAQKNVAISTIAVVVIVIVIIIFAGGAAYYYSTTAKAKSSSTTTTGSAVTSASSTSGSSPVATSGTNTSSSSSSALILYSADAYVNESTVLANSFSSATGIQVAPPKSAGSSALGQQIAEGNPVSVFISVSKTAIENSTLKSEYSGWGIAFAADQMGIAYSNLTTTNTAAKTVIDSFNKAASTNTTSAWFDFYSNLTSGAVKVGVSNPNEDPAGYRAWIVLQAAGQAYANNASYFVDRMLSNGGNVTGASAADLVAPLQSGNIQFLFIYKSDVVASGLNLLQLPSEVNLGSQSYNSFYEQFSYNTTGGLEKGGAIVLWITVPKDSTNYNESVRFVAYVVQNYKTLLSPYGLVYISPAKIYNDTDGVIPTLLETMLSNGTLANGGPLS